MPPIGLSDESEAGEGAPTANGTEPAPTHPAPPRAASKIASVTDLLQRGEGATLAELIAATDWLPHTTRAALTGLRKKGYAISKTERDGATCYHIAVVA